MRGLLQKLIADRNGNPSEHIIAGFLGTIMLWGLGALLIHAGQYPTLTEAGGAHGLVWGATGAGQWMSSRADTTFTPGQPGSTGSF